MSRDYQKEAEWENKKYKKILKSTCIFKKSMIRYYSCQR